MSDFQHGDNARRIAQVNDLLKLPAETDWVEFKHNNADPDRIGRTISALSNSARLTDQAFAYMVWGIEDGTRTILGTSFVPPTARHSGTLGQPLELWLRNAIKPDTNFEFLIVRYPGRNVVLLQIPAATTVPTKFNNIAYIRIGEATPKLADYPDKEASLLSKLRPFAWERGIALNFVPSQDVVELLDHAAYFRLAKLRAPDGHAAVLESLEGGGIIERDFGGHWNISNLGALLFATKLSDFGGVSRKSMRLIQYEESSRVTTRLERDAASGYASEFERIIDNIEGLLPKNEFIGKALRQERTVFPIVAIREIVANALIHQDLTITGAGPMIELFEDRMEVTNPGRPLIDTDRFIDMPPRSRNENIAALMRRMNICEERGSGIDKVIAMVEMYQLPPPEFRADSDNTKIILFGPRPFRDMSQQERVRACYHHAVLRYLTNQKATNSSLRERFGIHDRNASMVSRVINDTVEGGLIRPSEPWNARTGHYLPFWA